MLHKLVHPEPPRLLGELQQLSTQQQPPERNATAMIAILTKALFHMAQFPLRSVRYRRYELSILQPFGSFASVQYPLFVVSSLQSTESRKIARSAKSTIVRPHDSTDSVSNLHENEPSPATKPDEKPESRSLDEALSANGIELPPDQVAELDEYCQAVWEWNQKLNLTRHDTYDKFVTRDLVDSMQLADLIDEGERVLDVGTGSGVPGLVMCILRPDLDICVCDSVAKKAKAVGDVAAQLQMKIQVAHARAEEILEITSFDTLTARAVGPMIKMLRWFEPHWGSIGRLLLVKGPKWVEERGEARHHGLLAEMDLRKLASYTVPNAEWESVILSIRPGGDEEG